ncbi:hypothetical protein [Streptomyces sp. cg35]|uniref:hypothetical protein n=1 Tax=Streptomyces sp. cg35 TaxID=3421650 RepID=UPI003D1660C9
MQEIDEVRIRVREAEDLSVRSNPPAARAERWVNDYRGARHAPGVRAHLPLRDFTNQTAATTITTRRISIFM